MAQIFFWLGGALDATLFLKTHHILDAISASRAARGWRGGVQKWCADEVYPIFGLFGPFLAYFVYCGAFLVKTRSFWGHPPSADKTVIVGTMTPIGRGFTKNAPKCTKYAKMAKNGQK